MLGAPSTTAWPDGIKLAAAMSFKFPVVSFSAVDLLTQ